MSLSRPRGLVLAVAAVLVTALAPTGAAAAPPAPVDAVRSSSAAVGTVQGPAAGVVGFGDQSSLRRVGSVIYDSRRSAELRPQETRTLDVLGSTGPVPADATAVILTVTAVDMTADGWLTVWGDGGSRPAASTVNYVPGAPVPNTAVVTLGSSRTLKVTNGSRGSTHVLLSFQGYVLAGGTTVRPGSLRPLRGTRVLDTRTSAVAVPANGYRDVTLPAGSIPRGAAAAVLDVVAVKPTRAGYLVAHPSGTSRPSTTSLTYRVGKDRAALTVVGVSPTGGVRLWNMSSRPVHVVADAFGWVAGGGEVVPAGVEVRTPARILDTRTTSAGPLTGTTDRQLPATPGASSGTLLSVTVTGGTRSGYLRYGAERDAVTESGQDPFLWSGSFLNYAAGETVTATVFVPTPPRGGRLWIRAVTPGSVHVVVDRLAVVAPRAVISGTVRDADTGRAVSSPLVSADGRVGYGAGRADGTFDLVPVAPDAVQVCAGTGTWDGRELTTDGRYVAACQGGTGPSDPRVSLPLGARLVRSDVALAPSGLLTGQVLGPTGGHDVSGFVMVERVDAPMKPMQISFGVNEVKDTSWRAVVPPGGTYVVWTERGWQTGGDGSPLANEVATGLTRIPRQVEEPDAVAQLVAAGARTFVVAPTTTVRVPDLTLLRPGRIDPTIVDPDGDLSDVSIDYVHVPSGLRVWGYGTGKANAVGSSIPLRPGRYVVCVTEGSTRICNDGSDAPSTATPVQVVSGVTVEPRFVLP
ncbi:hypothetical protein [Phycicoccus jejuensis]|uniref:hypothetical protein n=1 Tax=Phycicoccus jejuensis TaxID=367299 RepID=UPI0004C3EB56|nr:hypothetical protein [Phycicoccus jejuensis]